MDALESIVLGLAPSFAAIGGLGLGIYVRNSRFGKRCKHEVWGPAIKADTRELIQHCRECNTARVIGYGE